VATGETVIEELVLTKEMPQEPEYQYHEATEPNSPPLTVRLGKPPVHIAGCDDVTPTALTENVLTLTNLLKQLVVLHIPSALT
jgi:hypothetical protein